MSSASVYERIVIEGGGAGATLARYAEIVAHDDDLARYGSMPGQIVGWGELEPLIREMFEGLLAIRITQADLRVLSPDRQVAWATCRRDFGARSGDPGGRGADPVPWVLERQQGTWVIIRFHELIGVA